jgi:carbon monoxide dehydrogenase subunit G
MIEADTSIVVAADIDSVWNYVKDIHSWANLMPGMQECAVLDTDNSRWTLKVGVGGLVRTVKVLVHVDEWQEPTRVNFSYTLEGDPVEGGGAYSATPVSDTETEVTLHVRVAGSGPMAPMWEAMSRPLLPQLAKSFAKQLKAEIEKTTAPAGEEASKESTGAFAALRKRLRKTDR